MNTIKKIIDHLEQLNIQVSEYKENKKLCGYELNTYTDAGVNMIIFLDFRDSEMNPKKAKDFIELFNERVNDVDISEELKMHSQDPRYMQDIGYEVGIQDFKDWKENLQSIFAGNGKTPQQRQFEQVKDKLTSLLEEMGEVLKLMPTKGNYNTGCQKSYIQYQKRIIENAVNGIDLEHFTPNKYSGDFKLSYS